MRPYVPDISLEVLLDIKNERTVKRVIFKQAHFKKGKLITSILK